MQIYILTAGKPKTGLKPNGLKVMPNGHSVLNWQMNVFRNIFPLADITVITGYKSSELIKEFPNVEFVIDPQWEQTKPINTLEKFSKVDDQVLITYGDTIFNENIIEKFSKIKSDITIGIDTLWKERFIQRSSSDINIAETFKINAKTTAEYTGLIKFNNSSYKKIKKLIYEYNISSFITLIEKITLSDFTVNFFDVKGSWAELNEPNDIAHFILSTKADTLKNLKNHLKLSFIEQPLIILYKDWYKSNVNLIKVIQKQFKDKKIIIRSSSFEEDSWTSSNAGEFDSFLNVNTNDTEYIIECINQVFASYSNLKSESQILIQKFVSNVKYSGVLFTCDLNTGAPYFILEYDKSGQTDTVTSGKSKQSKTLVICKHNHELVSKYNKVFLKLVEASMEISTLLNYNKIDIEFAIDKKNVIHIFQVRPIVVDHDKYENDENNFIQILAKASEYFLKLQKARTNILGSYTIFSNMSDWNPAEMIGIHPNPLALSLYQHLITNDIWAKQRAEFGYRDVRPHPLLFTFCGQPYIDVRVSLNSFIPKTLPNNVGERLVQAYLECLKEKPYLHDKIEFEIAFTIWTPDFYETAKKRLMSKGVFLDDIKLLEIELKVITKRSINFLKKVEANIVKLSSNFELVKKSNSGKIVKIYQLIKDCKDYGTLNFSHAARLGFISISFLNSFVQQGILTETRKLEFLHSLKTILSDFEYDLVHKSIDELIQIYGHLRPGSYDVNREAYWEKPEFYLTTSNNIIPNKKFFAFTDLEMNKINNFAKKLDENLTGKNIIDFIEESIKLREKMKFLFTKNLSFAIDLLIEFGKTNQITRELIAFMKWPDLELLKEKKLNINNLKTNLNNRKLNYEVQRLVNLPPVITHKDDFFCYEIPDTVPNFITKKNITGEIILLNDLDKSDLNSKIILIPEADPGYDWIFKYKISGLITIYGGANSHMSIRCAEKSIPAAIGVGEKYFDYICKFKYVELDCENHFIKGKGYE